MPPLRRFTERHPAVAVFLLGLLVLPPATWQAARFAERAATESLKERSQATLALSLAGLRNELRRYQTLPRVLAGNPLFAELLAAPRSPMLTARANGYLEHLATVTGASDIYLMNSSGLTLAASNWDSDASFVGQNFNFRPYFQGALAGGTGRFYALGTTSERRGYYFAYPVEQDDGVSGVLAVKVDVSKVEQSWRAGPDEVLVSGELDVLFMSSRPQWVFRSLRPLSDEEFSRVALERQYPAHRVAPLRAVTETSAGGATRTSISGPDGRRVEYLAQSAEMPETGWRVHVLADASGVRTQARTAAVTVALALALLLLALAWALQRRTQIRERLMLHDQTQRLLEERVRERTAELEREVAERSAAEDELRRTQNELVQASKLSALGQVSAGISHELNQPLSAIRSFADNAQKLFERGRSAEARDNLARISHLTERMARIIRNLRTFARKEAEDVVPVNFSSVIEDSLALLERRMRQMDVHVQRQLPDDSVWVHGGPVRLQQVVMNVVANALDAMEDSASRELHIALASDAAEATLLVRDSGRGIAPGVIDDIFAPFFTTKEVQEGLGLGLSISYGIVRGFGGSISAGNAPGGGAEFRIRLRLAESPEVSHAGAA